ncbi:uncharacterized protein BDV17DRAFT_288927 [Aspergillus undulatus]|uniref:uncharacterized protein n=1 Tax=Aspergillus undulatus TaxID=1810928 RepID=UPI003CCDD29E
MSTQTYEDPSHAIIHKVSSALASKDIGCLLWGEHLLRTYASSITATDYKFLFEDDEIFTAYDALLDSNTETNTGFTECDGAYSCPVLYKMDEVADPDPHPSEFHDFPTAHVHLHEDSNNPYPIVIGLYAKSQYLPMHNEGEFAVMDPPLIIPGFAGRLPSQGRFICAHEIGPRPSKMGNHGGRFEYHLGKDVLLPSPMYLIETLILLGNRDSRVPGARNIWTYWLSELRIAYINHNQGLDAWDEKGLSLPEMLRPVWKEAIDSEISKLDEPVMSVWRNLAWDFAGVQKDLGIRWKFHLGYSLGMEQWERWPEEW